MNTRDDHLALVHRSKKALSLLQEIYDTFFKGGVLQVYHPDGHIGDLELTSDEIVGRSGVMAFIMAILPLHHLMEALLAQGMLKHGDTRLVYRDISAYCQLVENTTAEMHMITPRGQIPDDFLYSCKLVVGFATKLNKVIRLSLIRVLQVLVNYQAEKERALGRELGSFLDFISYCFRDKESAIQFMKEFIALHQAGAPVLVAPNSDIEMTVLSSVPALVSAIDASPLSGAAAMPIEVSSLLSTHDSFETVSAETSEQVLRERSESLSVSDSIELLSPPDREVVSLQMQDFLEGNLPVFRRRSTTLAWLGGILVAPFRMVFGGGRAATAEVVAEEELSL